LTDSLERDVDVVVTEVRQQMVGLYVHSLGRLCWNYCFQIAELEGWAHLAFSLPLCAALAQPEASPQEVRQLAEAKLASPIGKSWATEDEYEVTAQLVKIIVAELEKAWEPVSTVSVGCIHLQTVPAFIYVDRATDPALRVRFEVRSGKYEDLSLHLCYLASTIEPALPDLSNS
jgi:hypothetical protein